jgi:hypothetical protein
MEVSHKRCRKVFRCGKWVRLYSCFLVTAFTLVCRQQLHPQASGRENRGRCGNIPSLIMATNVYPGCRKRQRILQRGSLGMKHKERRGA